MKKPFIPPEKQRFYTTAAIAVAIILFVVFSPKKSPPPKVVEIKETAPFTEVFPATFPDIGFTSRRSLDEHYEKHGSEFGKITKDEYLRKAQQLRDTPENSVVLYFERQDHTYVKYQTKHNEFIAYNEDLTIRTFFKPNDGIEYFERQKRR
ncbi:MAG: hypothetical protein KDC26_05595 [Armatimonadetes bacterium]|nr:hypothetical protein [Armatimonadota bacterium]